MKAIHLLFIVTLLLGSTSSCNSDTGKNQNKNLEMNERLIGVEIDYQYEEGNQYTIKFEESGTSYQFHKGGKRSKGWNGPYSYNHLITDMNEHMVSWHEPDKQDYVTLLINFDKMILYGSAILKGKKVHFQKAQITKLTEQ